MNRECGITTVDEVCDYTYFRTLLFILVTERNTRKVEGSHFEQNRPSY